MNTYDSKSAWSVPTPEVGTPEMIPTMSRLVALADQVEAGVRDVRFAWDEFVFGGNGRPDRDVANGSKSNDRMHEAAFVLSRQIEQLSALAAEIRERAGK